MYDSEIAEDVAHFLVGCEEFEISAGAIGRYMQTCGGQSVGG